MPIWTLKHILLAVIILPFNTGSEEISSQSNFSVSDRETKSTVNIPSRVYLELIWGFKWVSSKVSVLLELYLHCSSGWKNCLDICLHLSFAVYNSTSALLPRVLMLFQKSVFMYDVSWGVPYFRWSCDFERYSLDLSSTDSWSLILTTDKPEPITYIENALGRNLVMASIKRRNVSMFQVGTWLLF